MGKILAVLSILGLLFQINLAQAADLSSTKPVNQAYLAEAFQPGAINSVPAVPLDKYLRNNGFKPEDIVQVVPVPPAQPVQTGGAASIQAVPLKDYVRDNGFNPDRIKQFVPVPPATPAMPSPTGGAATCPTILQPIITPAPEVRVTPQTPSTGGAAPVQKPVKGLW